MAVPSVRPSYCPSHCVVLHEPLWHTPPSMRSLFLDIPCSDWVASNALAFAVRDAFPVNDGHTLVIPRRLVASWREATPAL